MTCSRKKTILFRLDAHNLIGAGHHIRCFALSQWLEKAINHRVQQEIECVLITRCLQGIEPLSLPAFPKTLYLDPIELANSAAMPLGVSSIKDAEETLNLCKRNNLNDIDWFVIDHYGIDHEWCSVIRSMNAQILMIDELLGRMISPDVLVYPGEVGDSSIFKQWCFPSVRNVFHGLEYLLIRPELYQRKMNQRPREFDGIHKVVIILGGTDVLGDHVAIFQVLETYQHQSEESFAVDVLSLQSPTSQETQLLARIKGTWHLASLDIGAFLSAADLVIGNAGTGSFERLLLGVPSIVLQTALNQSVNMQVLEEHQAAYLLKLDMTEPFKSQIRQEQIKSQLLKALHAMQNVDLRKMYHQNGQALIDGLGGQRISEKILL